MKFRYDLVVTKPLDESACCVLALKRAFIECEACRSWARCCTESSEETRTSCRFRQTLVGRPNLSEQIGSVVGLDQLPEPLQVAVVHTTTSQWAATNTSSIEQRSGVHVDQLIDL
jgi:hypothetical protein